MKGKWAQGIVPRSFAWVIKDCLAVCERPGGYGENHRRVRRQEEIIWIKQQGFTRVISLLPTPHNLHAYDEHGLPYEHRPFPFHDDPAPFLRELYADLRRQLEAGDRLLVHHEEMGDVVTGVMAGYLVHSGVVPEGPRAVAIVEHLLERQIGPQGRDLVRVAGQLSTGG